MGHRGHSRVARVVPARRGAEARITELQQEMDAIHAAFPELRGDRKSGQTGRGARGGTEGVSVSAQAAPTRRRGRPRMTAAQRKAVSQRMRKYWAARRKANAGKK